mgnify:CR=1 FL=1|nr:hypothetical protein [Sphingomonas sp. SCN 67-18]
MPLTSWISPSPAQPNLMQSRLARAGPVSTRVAAIIDRSGLDGG